MKRFRICLAASFLVSGLAGGATAADCVVSGGGKFETADGIAKFGGSIHSTSEGRISGAWFITAADGSKFHATDFDRAACTVNGIDFIGIEGVGIWNGEVIRFSLAVIEDNLFDIPVTIDLTILELMDPLIEIATIKGKVTHGHAKVTVGS